ncbi:hypothetical protein LTR37_018539 [Vermiconidia calcicola]|uniref:Uncharacterized protein n=1 Tax=Vermiconidia calcicola TaxID=1690605 RepID=A0ACC3MH12_9PEZI|nr:hypothetical protein LTR37_018539 [Vermiconidia calcicola]
MWSSDEDEILRCLVDKYGLEREQPESFEIITCFFKDRTAHALHSQHRKIRGLTVLRFWFSQNEKDLILKIRDIENKSFEAIANELGTTKINKGNVRREYYGMKVSYHHVAVPRALHLEPNERMSAESYQITMVDPGLDSLLNFGPNEENNMEFGPGFDEHKAL